MAIFDSLEASIVREAHHVSKVLQLTLLADQIYGAIVYSCLGRGLYMAVLRITKEKLKEQLDKGEMVVLLDVRSHDSYNMSNIKIKGSLRKDPVAVKSWEREIPRDKPIITYCT